jgi:hypothetical protein
MTEEFLKDFWEKTHGAMCFKELEMAMVCQSFQIFLEIWGSYVYAPSWYT